MVEAAAEQFRASGLDASAWAGDASDEDGMDELVGAIVDRHGRLDVMACNAGGLVGGTNAPDLPLSDLEGTLREHVGTTLVSAQAAARAMIPQQRGAIITVGPIHDSLGSDGRQYEAGFRRSSVSYHAAKGAIINLTRALACEFGQYGATFNCVSPGQIPKDRLESVARERQRDAIPPGRLGVPDDLRGAVALFASPSGRWITGQNLTVDGGWSVW